MFKRVSAIADEPTANDRELIPRTAYITVWIIFVGGILISACAIRTDWIVYQSKSWPRAEGRVVSVDWVNNNRAPTYTYQYITNGKTQTSTNIAAGWDDSYYPLGVGERVVVRYWPSAKPYSFLVKPDTKGDILVHVIGFGWFAMGGIALFALVRGPRWRNKRREGQPPSDGNVR